MKSYDGLEIIIKKRHIIEGRRCSRLYCPVNRAIKDRLRKAKIIVELDRIIIDGVHYESSHKLRNFMNMYDNKHFNKNHIEGMVFTLKELKF